MFVCMCVCVKENFCGYAYEWVNEFTHTNKNSDTKKNTQLTYVKIISIGAYIKELIIITKKKEKHKDIKRETQTNAHTTHNNVHP